MLDKRPLILQYHTITNLKHDPYRIIVSIKNFESQIKQISSSKTIIPLKELVCGIIKKEIPRNSIVITFDDGYADNFTNAIPILQKYNAPATFFVVTKYINSRKEFWWDLLERIFLQPNNLPSELHLKIGNIKKRWRLNENYSYTLDEFNNNLDWCAYNKNQFPTIRHKIVSELFEIFEKSNEISRNYIIRKLLEWAGCDQKPRKSHRIMTTAELRKISKNTLFSIGSHTLHHSGLAYLNYDEQVKEIMESKKELEIMLNKPVDFFSVPHGIHTNETLNIVKRSGFLAACTSNVARITSKTKVFELPRLELLNVPFS